MKITPGIRDNDIQTVKLLSCRFHKGTRRRAVRQINGLIKRASSEVMDLLQESLRSFITFTLQPATGYITTSLSQHLREARADATADASDEGTIIGESNI